MLYIIQRQTTSYWRRQQKSKCKSSVLQKKKAAWDISSAVTAQLWYKVRHRSENDAIQMHIMLLCEGKTHLVVSERVPIVLIHYNEVPLTASRIPNLKRGWGVQQLTTDNKSHRGPSTAWNHWSRDGITVHGKVMVGFSVLLLAP